MSYLYARHFLLLHLVLGVRAQDIPLPIQIIPSATHYGPDGPWQAVSVSLGSPAQQLDLYPGSTFETILLSTGTCKGVKQLCGTGGLYDPNQSQTIDKTSISFTGHSFGDTVDWTIGAMLDQGRAQYAMDQLTIGSKEVTVPNVSIRMMESVNMTYPDGTAYPLQLGQLALGASVANQSFTIPGSPEINASLLPNWLQAHKYIPTSSYGMHIGSAALNLPLSLWLGGYDMSRVLGPVSAQPYSANIANNNFLIDLLDIGIGVDHGGSPWPYETQQGLLAEKNTSITSVSVSMNTAAPYLYLPNSTCTALTKDLPVTYNAKFGLYIWDVNNPQYKKIITAPTYLSFVFRTSGQNLTVKVPFQLLNLTLDTPLINKPTQYFPCTTPQDSPSYSLGRAFLQAAFIGVDWDQGLGQWFLAQAPGPNTAKTPSQTAITGTTLQGSNSDWAESWKPVWTALPLASSNSSTNQTPSSNHSTSPQSTIPPTRSHLTPGASAGIGVGVACVVLALIMATVFMCRKRRKGKEARLEQAAAQRFYDHDAENKEKHFFIGPAPIYEAPAFQQPLELGSAENIAHELGGASRSDRQLPPLPTND